MMMERTGILPRGARAALVALGALTALAGGAFAVEPEAPRPGEIRLTLKLNERSVSFASTLEPLVRRTLAFEGNGYAPTDAMRAGAAEIRAALPASDAKTAFVVTAYAADPTIAYRRARAVRGELIERHQLPAGSIVAAGRAAPGHVGGATIVDIHMVDPGKCTGCGPTPFRAIAFDSGTMRLVTALPEMLAAQPRPQAAQAPSETPAGPAESLPAAEVRTQPAPAAPPTARAPAGSPAPAAETASKPPVARIVPAAPRRDIAAPAPLGGCQRPRVIIDDYYPGGPLVPCRRPAGRD